jgi:hypothetical protein
MPIEIRSERHESLTAYAVISTAFEVREVVDVERLRSNWTNLPLARANGERVRRRAARDAVDLEQAARRPTRDSVSGPLRRLP